MKSGRHLENGLFGLPESLPEWGLSGDENIEGVMGNPNATRARVSTKAPIHFARMRVGVLLMVLAGVLLLGKTAYLQLIRGGFYRALAEQNRIRIHATPSHRGILKDRNGIALAENLPTFRLVAYSSQLPVKVEERRAMLNYLAMKLNLSVDDLTAKTSEQKPPEELLLAEDIDYEKAIAYMGGDVQYPGISVELSEMRGYPTDAIPTLSHVIGYTGPVSEKEYASLKDDGYRKFDVVGKQGIEASREVDLRGSFGQEVLEVNAKGEPLRTISEKDPVDGKDLTLTIDARLQAYIEMVLENKLKNVPVKKAAVVAMNPQNGEVLALVSYPAFDANLFAKGISTEKYQALVDDPDAPLFPRAMSGQYPSGSIIKPIFASAALIEGIVTPQKTFLSTGGLKLGDHFFPDWRPGGHGITNIYHAIADSVNTYFYMIGGGNESFKGLGVEKLMSYARLFGLATKTGIGLPGEADGFLPSKEWKKETKGEDWFLGDTYNVSIGQGDVLVTPLQMARATAVIANGGSLVNPYLVIGEDEGSTRIIDQETAGIVRDAMRTTVTNGTASSLQSLPVPSAGKTGTAQWNVNKVPHSWFTGFAPFDNPKIVLAVIVEEGGDITAATPVAKDILDWYLRQP
ncbi:MAG: penicillin-binding protein 2 [Patescibacteria group bacterium]|jgi:penicillin-binding protein 2